MLLAAPVKCLDSVHSTSFQAGAAQDPVGRGSVAHGTLGTGSWAFGMRSIHERR